MQPNEPIAPQGPSPYRTHDWDTHGALCAGMNAAYIQQLPQTPYNNPLFKKPDIEAQDLETLVAHIIASKINPITATKQNIQLNKEKDQTGQPSGLFYSFQSL